MRLGRWWMPGVLGLVGCFNLDEEIRQRRVWEMEDHEQDFFSARDALRRKDLASARQAGAGLGRKDPLPGVPENTRPFIEGVRASGARLENAPDLSAAATELVAMTAQCAACHRTLSISAPAPVDDREPANRAFMAVVFEDDAMWTAAQAGATAGWDARRAELAASLTK